MRSLNQTKGNDLGLVEKKLPTEITEDTVREAAFPMGIVDVKACAVDEKWSGVKLIIRRENRI